MSTSKTHSEAPHIAHMLSLMLSVANRLSETDTFLRQGLTVPEWALLNAFPAGGAEIDIKRVANAVGLSPQRVKVLIVKLESRGMIQLATAAEAQGVRRYAITSRGASLVSEADKALFEMQAALDPSQERTLARAVRVTRRLLKPTRRVKPAQ